MTRRTDLTVIASSLAVVKELKSQHFFNLVAMRWLLKTSLYDNVAYLEVFCRFNSNREVFEVGGSCTKHSLTTGGIAEAEIERAMIDPSSLAQITNSTSKIVKLVSMAPHSAVHVVGIPMYLTSFVSRLQGKYG